MDDTSVLIYATLVQDSRHTAARAVLDRGRARSCEAFISVQNLAELNVLNPFEDP